MHFRLIDVLSTFPAIPNKTVGDLRCQGVRAQKVHLDVHELSAWCKKHRCPLDADARAAYVSELLRGGHS